MTKLFKRCVDGVVLFFLFPFLGSCNLYQAVDKPGKNCDQVLSHAFSCYDNPADFGKSSQPSKCFDELNNRCAVDPRLRENSCFALLSEKGLSISDLLVAVTGTSGGNLIGAIAGKFVPKASESERKDLFKIYRECVVSGGSHYIEDQAVRGAVRVLLSLFIMAEVLAESTIGDPVLRATHLVTNPTACKAAPAAQCIITSACSSANLNGGPEIDFLSPGNNDLSGGRHLGMIHGALKGIIHGAVYELNARGRVVEKLTKISDALKIIDPAFKPSNCYLQAMINAGIGQM